METDGTEAHPDLRVTKSVRTRYRLTVGIASRSTTCYKERTKALQSSVCNTCYKAEFVTALYQVLYRDDYYRKKKSQKTMLQKPPRTIENETEKTGEK